MSENLWRPIDEMPVKSEGVVGRWSKAGEWIQANGKKLSKYNEVLCGHIIRSNFTHWLPNVAPPPEDVRP